MVEINIEINISDKRWTKILPGVEELIKKSVVLSLEQSGITKFVDSIEVSVLLSNDKFIQVLNRDYLGKNKATNVLSFPSEVLFPGKYKGIEANIALGDIIFAIETIQNESIEQDKLFENHLSHLAVHGALHLLGFDHENDADAETMESLEIKILGKLQIPNPY